MTKHPPGIDAARWVRLSPLLDELLELETAARARRLSEWRARDPQLAADLQRLLDSVQSARDERFLEDRLAAPEPAGAGTVCGDWALDRPLGAGGMGSVWLAHRVDGRYQGRAAVKLPHAAVLAHGGAERFEREGRLLARLSHPHIAGLLDAGVATGGQPYLVLEYVQGEAIDLHCERRRLGVEARVALFLDVLAAVAHAHGQMVLHRDLKPSNILVDGAGQVKLLDFGIARLLDAGESAAPAEAGTVTRAFTPDFVAPEQVQGGAVGVATDVYALGVLLYLLLTGRHPTTQPAASAEQRLRAVLDSVPPPMSAAATPRALADALRGDLDAIVAKALRKAPADRFATAADFAADLRRWRQGLPVLAQPDRASYRARLFVRRHRVAVGAAAAAAVLLAAGVLSTAWQATVARRERDQARLQAERALARSELLNLMLGQMGRLDAPLTQREILEGAVRLIESRHAAQPHLAVDLLLPIAGQFHTMGDIGADLAVMERATRLARASGDPGLVATTLCSTVDTYIKLDRLADAQAALAAAAESMAGLPAPPPPLQATCWRYEAELAVAQGQVPKALASAERARRRLEETAETGGNLYPSLLSLLAFLYGANGDPAAAMAAVDRLAALHRAGQREGTLDAAMVERRRAVLLAEAGELAPARQLLRDLVARFGQPEQAPLPMLFSLALVELDSGHGAEAEAATSQLESAGRAPGSVGRGVWPPFLRLLAALEAGRAEEARRWLDAIDPGQSARALGQVTPTLEVARARVLLAEKRVGDAAAAIEAELERLQSAGIGNLERRADAWRTAATIQLAAGNPGRAGQHARAALDAATRAARDPEASAHVGHARLLLAQAHLGGGDAARAREEAARGAHVLLQALGPAHRLVAEAQSLAR